MQPERSRDLTRTLFQVVALGALVAMSFWIVRPFLVAILWAAAIATSTWPILLRAQSWLGGRRGFAVALMTTILLLILLVPFYFAITTITENIGRIPEWSKSVATLTLPEPPAWIQALPLVGAKLATQWHQLAAIGPEQLAARLAPFARTAALWFLSQVGNLGLLLVQFLITVIITAIMFANGETAARGTVAFSRRLAGAEGEKAVRLAAQAVRSVALGVVVTAIVQSALSGIGLAVAGVPFVTLLTAMIFVLSVAQIGPAPVLICAVIWVYSRSGTIWGTGLLIWSIFCQTFDNLLRPLLIKRGADIPLLLIFVGVVGGLIAFGVIGLFIGPVVLAVAHTLFIDWMSETEITARRRRADS